VGVWAGAHLCSYIVELMEKSGDGLQREELSAV
jgi:hypothetical protein